MLVLGGLAALCAAVVLYAWGHGRHHAPDAAPMFRGQLFASAICLSVAALTPLGVGLLMAGLAQPWDIYGDAGLAILAATPIMAWAVRPRRAHAGGAATAI
jgi:hypothetical protein